MAKINMQNNDRGIYRKNLVSLPGKGMLAEKWFASDEHFDQLYPLPIQGLTHRHWTPLHVAQKAADFLAAEDNVRILDIGSGVGKFCLGASYYKPGAFYYGIEQRKSLIRHAETAKELLHLENVSFIHGNFTQLDFKNYHHFYFFNAFYENLAGTDKIDDSIDYSGELYNYYCRYLYKQLEQMPDGTRLVTYHSLEDEIPPGYHIVGEEMSNVLKFWVKI
ncbi:MAG: class I SAM-dependent methyltransferase [Bacteroidota bacterium]|nr:class I SAM-dependent methyltransferase [Bacteroidota bacterium]